MRFAEWIRLIEANSKEFAKAIRQNPDDVQVLVFADWLEEQGDKRSEIIHLLVRGHLPSGATFAIDTDRLSELLDKKRGPMLIQAIETKLPEIKPWFRMQTGVVQQEIAEEWFKKVLPHGSGIDGTWEIEVSQRYYVASCDYHQMDENGYYAGWIPFRVFFNKSNVREFRIQIRETRYTYGLGEDLYQQIDNAISQAIPPR